MLERNPGCELDLEWIDKVYVNLTGVNNRAATLQQSRTLSKKCQAAWLLKTVTFVDLTTLSGDDTHGNVSSLCYQAFQPLPDSLVNAFFPENSEDRHIRTAAVCVYPSKVESAVQTLRRINIPHKINVASVATGFPSGQMPLETRLGEIKYAIQKGATEIDIVIDRSLVLTGQWTVLFNEIKQMREACGNDAHMKTILAAGELGDLTKVYKASMIAMMAGSDFIKTSTGKESLNATIPFGIVMCRAIRDYYVKYGYKVGLKPAGGIRTSKDALSWLILVKELLGDEWLTPELFRIGASGLLKDIEKNLCNYVKNK